MAASNHETPLDLDTSAAFLKFSFTEVIEEEAFNRRSSIEYKGLHLNGSPITLKSELTKKVDDLVFKHQKPQDLSERKDSGNVEVNQDDIQKREISVKKFAARCIGRRFIRKFPYRYYACS